MFFCWYEILHQKEKKKKALRSSKSWHWRLLLLHVFYVLFYLFFRMRNIVWWNFQKREKKQSSIKDKSISAHENQPTKPEKLSSHVIGCGGARAFSCIVLQLLNDLCSVMFIFVCHSFIACYMCTFFPFHHMCTVYASWRYYYTFLSHKGFWLVPFQAVNRKHITQ